MSDYRSSADQDCISSAYLRQLQPQMLRLRLHLQPLRQLLLLAFHLAGMQACLGLFLEGLPLVGPFSCPMLGQAGVLLSAQRVNR